MSVIAIQMSGNLIVCSMDCSFQLLVQANIEEEKTMLLIADCPLWWVSTMGSNLFQPTDHPFVNDMLKT